MTSVQWVQSDNFSCAQYMVYKICILAMQLTFSGDVSSKFGHGNAKFKLLFISLKIDCFYGL